MLPGGVNGLSRLRHAEDVQGDHQVLLRRHDLHLYARGGGADGLDAIGARVRWRGESFDAQSDKIRKNFIASVGIVLTDATGEDDSIQPAEQPAVSADGLGDGARKDLERELCGRIAAGCGSADRLHIVGHSGKDRYAGFVIEHGFYCDGSVFATSLLLAQQIKHESGVEVAGARTHHHAAGGREAHGGIDGAAILQCRDAATAAKVRDDDTL